MKCRIVRTLIFRHLAGCRLRKNKYHKIKTIYKKSGPYYVISSVLTLFHALKWSRKSSKVFCSKATIVMLRRQDEFGSFRCFSIAVRMALMDSFGAKPPRPAENKTITQGYIFSHSASRECFSMTESVCCHACSNRRNGQSSGRFGFAEVQNLF